MPANKNALIRYKTIDRCLSNRYRRWTLDDLVDACCMALNEMEGLSKGVSVRTVQGDIQMMRSDKLGYNAPIEVYDLKYYRYSDPDYTITGMPLSSNDVDVLQEAVDMLQQLQDFDQFGEMADVINRLQDKLSVTRQERSPIVHYDSVPDLRGLKLLSPLYDHIAHHRVLHVFYQSFKQSEPVEYILHPYLLKEFRNRWFLFGCTDDNMLLFNLALDRIVGVTPAKGIAFRQNPDFDAEHFFDDVIGVSKNLKGSNPRRVKFWANSEQSNYIKTKPLHPSQKLISQDPDDGSCIFQIEVVINYEMYSVFMSYGAGIKVISPVNAVKFMGDQLRAAADLYDTTTDTP
ncbi:MAG: WYL domain-containing protein [Muribaculaceae bacterium]|nr:WYL domain-containing protein [Muribaculaceae bacterium]